MIPPTDHHWPLDPSYASVLGVQLSTTDAVPHSLIVPPQQVVDEFVVYVHSSSTEGGPEVTVTSPHRDPTVLGPFVITLRREQGSLMFAREKLPSHAALSRHTVRSYHYRLHRVAGEEVTVTTRWIPGSPTDPRAMSLDDQATEVTP
jgi:hypothetical protein